MQAVHLIPVLLPAFGRGSRLRIGTLFVLTLDLFFISPAQIRRICLIVSQRFVFLIIFVNIDCRTAAGIHNALLSDLTGGVGLILLLGTLLGLEILSLLLRGSGRSGSAGFALLRAADGYQRLYPFLPVAEVHMKVLAERWKQNVMLAVYKSPCYLVKLRLQSGQPHIEPSRVSGVMNALRSAGGKLLMATLSEDEIRRDLQQGPSPLLLPKTDYDLDDMMQQIKTLRNAPYEIERNEYSVGRGSIAVPVYNRQGKVIAAISGPLDLTRLDSDTERQMIADFTATGLQISADLGYPVSFF